MSLAVTATVRAPLTVPDRRGSGNRIATLPYVPGTTLRGALAARWIAENGVPAASTSGRSEFITLFESDIGYGPLLPRGASFEPVSIMRCKYPRNHGCATFAPDLVDHLDGDAPVVCASCQGPLETGKGRLLTPGRGHTYDATRTQLTEQETAEDRTLHTTEAIRPGTVLSGRIDGTHPWLTSVNAAHIGRRRTVGGRVDLGVVPVDPPAPGSRADGAVVVRLTSPAVLVDRWGAPATGFALDEVASVLGCEVADLGPTHEWSRTDRSGGWHAASGLPKPEEITLTPGSTLVLRPPTPIPSDRLSELTRAGLGLRRNEGFGRVEVNPPTWSPPSSTEPSDPTAGSDDPGDRGDHAWVARLTSSDTRYLIDLLRQRRARPDLAVALPERRRRDLPPTVAAAIDGALAATGEDLDATIAALRGERRPSGGRR